MSFQSENFEYSPISENDVLCGNIGRKLKDHVGNVSYRRLVDERSPEYDSAPTAVKMKLVVRQAIQEIHRRGGRFLEKSKSSKADVWEVMSDPVKLHKFVAQRFRQVRDPSSAQSSNVPYFLAEGRVLGPSPTALTKAELQPYDEAGTSPAISGSSAAGGWHASLAVGQHSQQQRNLPLPPANNYLARATPAVSARRDSTMSLEEEEKVPQPALSVVSDPSVAGACRREPTQEEKDCVESLSLLSFSSPMTPTYGFNHGSGVPLAIGPGSVTTFSHSTLTPPRLQPTERDILVGPGFEKHEGNVWLKTKVSALLETLVVKALEAVSENKGTFLEMEKGTVNFHEANGVACMAKLTETIANEAMQLFENNRMHSKVAASAVQRSACPETGGLVGHAMPTKPGLREVGYRQVSSGSTKHGVSVPVPDACAHSASQIQSIADGSAAATSVFSRPLAYLQRKRSLSRSDSNRDATGANTISGYLFKKGKNSDKHKKRWFELDGDRLLYYRNKDDKRPKDQIDLGKAGPIEIDNADTTRRTFCIDSSDRRYYLRAGNPDECRNWVNALSQFGRPTSQRSVMDDYVYASSHNAGSVYSMSTDCSDTKMPAQPPVEPADAGGGAARFNANAAAAEGRSQQAYARVTFDDELHNPYFYSVPVGTEPMEP